MARAPDPRIEQAKAMYLKGRKLIEIAKDLDLPEGTVRSWKNRYKWDCNVANGKRNVAKTKTKRKQGAQPGNKNSSGGPLRNKKAEKYGFFSKYLPEETQEIFSAIDQANPLDLLWHQIQIAYTAIIRAQKISYVRDQRDKTVEKIENKTGNVIGEKWEIQQAWDKQNEFMKAQARAQGELRAMIRQYDKMLHEDWETVSEEQRARLAKIKIETERLQKECVSGNELVDDWIAGIMGDDPEGGGGSECQ